MLIWLHFVSLILHQDQKGNSKGLVSYRNIIKSINISKNIVCVCIQVYKHTHTHTHTLYDI
jgi:hypothetical protein